MLAPLAPAAPLRLPDRDGWSGVGLVRDETRQEQRIRFLRDPQAKDQRETKRCAFERRRERRERDLTCLGGIGRNRQPVRSSEASDRCIGPVSGKGFWQQSAACEEPALQCQQLPVNWERGMADHKNGGVVISSVEAWAPRR